MDELPRRRAYAGPAFLSGGFRPFFLFGAVIAAVYGAAWLPVFDGELALPTRFSALDWHVHEMLFGALPAMIAGFLLTAIPNWTGRLPIQGTPLAALFATWIAGRLAVTFSLALPVWVVALVDLAFLVMLIAVAAREIVAGNNWRNLRVIAPLGVLLLANALFHYEAARWGAVDHGKRLGIAAVLTLIMLIGGRVIPSFTRNWLARQEPGRMPAPFDCLDGVAMAVAVGALLAWVLAPAHVVTGAALLTAGMLHVARLSRWAGERTFPDRLVLVLHVAYAFIPLGFILGGLSALSPKVAASAGIHAWTVGAFGTMTLAVMSRATLGHTGRQLRAAPSLQIIYAMIAVAALARVAAAFWPSASFALLHVTAGAWFVAYFSFAVMVWPMMWTARR